MPKASAKNSSSREYAIKSEVKARSMPCATLALRVCVARSINNE